MKSWDGSRLIRVLLVALLWSLSGYANAGDRLTVFTVNYPLQYFAERIAGDEAEVRFPAPEAVDPALWNPDADSLGQFQRADLVLLNGAGYAAWADRLSLPGHKQVNTSASFARAYLPAQETSSGGSASAGSEPDSVTWLDFYQAAQQAEAVMQALIGKRPQQQARFERNFALLRQELMDLDLAMQRLVENHTAKPLFVSRPLYQYFARRYELRLQSVAWRPEVMPSDPDWEQLVFAQESFPAAWMLWEAEPIAAIRERLRSMGVGVVVFSPCASRPAQGDFLDVMKRNLESLKPVFAGS